MSTEIETQIQRLRKRIAALEANLKHAVIVDLDEFRGMVHGQSEKAKSLVREMGLDTLDGCSSPQKVFP